MRASVCYALRQKKDMNLIAHNDDPTGAGSHFFDKIIFSWLLNPCAQPHNRAVHRAQRLTEE